MGSIYAGICTPTEAGGIGAFGALISAAIYRQLNWKNIQMACTSALIVNAMVMWLLISGSAFAALLTMTGVSHFISDGLTSLGVGPLAILSMMMLITLFMGMFMDGAALIVILIPIFMPVVYQIGVDPLWFGLLFIINMTIGYITPPFGMNLFYTKGIVPPDVAMTDIFRSVLPYVVLMIIVLVLCIVFPPLLLWLPNMMIK